MANRNVFEFFHSGEMDYMNVDGGFVMSYHSNYISGRTYNVGSVVRLIDASTSALYVCTYKNSNIPSSLNGWDKLSNDSTVVYRQMIDVDGKIMIDSNGDNLKTI